MFLLSKKNKILLCNRKLQNFHNQYNMETKTILNNEQENQLLLNAIKNKFAAQTANEAAAFSPPKFNIPLLKIPSNKLECSKLNVANNISNSQTNNPSPASSQLNQFLLKQLQEKHTNNGLTKEIKTGFKVPQLQLSAQQQTGVKYELPVLKTNSTNSNISSLTTAINKLQVEENHAASTPNTCIETPAIDLTTALASKLHSHQGTPTTRDFIKPQQLQNDHDVNFVIPFIDCDRVDNSGKIILLNDNNKFCITDISQLALQHTLVEPSVIGRFLKIVDNKYSAPLPLYCFSAEYQQQRVKHSIVPFLFDTKSPDDIVLEALNKYQRRHYN